ncbi:MAG: phytanoyl-CoA dioxygenase family protein [Actinobacteria bacterium]|nr:phytanoyl-CoA dioxygenase family protein [Actinomycetota bacterium]
MTIAAAGSPTIDFDEFHRTELPARLSSGNGALAVQDVERIGPLAIRLAGTDRSYTYEPAGATIAVEPGDAGARVVIELDGESFTGLALDLDTLPGLLYRGKVAAVRGNVRRALRWEAALRSMYHGLPIFDPEHADLRGLDGEPLDPTETYSLADDAAMPAHFLHTMGYVVVKNVFADDEVAAMLGAAQRLRDEAVEGDHRSWWGKNAGGESLLTRVLDAGREPVLRGLYDDRRLLQMAAWSDFELVPRGRGRDDAVTVLWKLPGMVEGLADIPWHRDCGMGGHASGCPRLIATVCLTDGSAAAGELRVLPGSWTGSVNFMKPDDPDAPHGVGLATTAGDVSLHYSDSMHASLPPTGAGPFRISALISFVRPDARVHRGGERTYNDPLLHNDDGQVEHLDKIVDRL